MKLKELNLNLDSYINPDELRDTAICLNIHPRLYARKYFPGKDESVKSIKLFIVHFSVMIFLIEKPELVFINLFEVT